MQVVIMVVMAGHDVVMMPIVMVGRQSDVSAGDRVDADEVVEHN